jgi:large-conductance mechanosensitive channel
MKLRIIDKNDVHETRADRARLPAIFISMMIVTLMVVMGFCATISVQAYASPTAVDLGTSGDFAILAKTAISTTGTTHIWGDIGISPAAASYITGFGLIADASNQFSTSSLVTGNVYASDYTAPTPTKMTTAVSDMETAYTDAAGRAADATGLGAGDITSMTIYTGCYAWGTGLLISAAGVTISGSATDVFIFQIAGTLTVANGAIVTLAGGAQASNIFWQVAGQVSLGTTAAMKGIILGQTAIVMNTGATLNGKALAQTAVTLIGNNVITASASTYSGDGAPPLTTLALTPATPSGEHGWYGANVSMNLTATDFGTPSPAGVNTTEYRLNSGAWMNYSTAGMNVTLNQSSANSTGSVRIDYRSWDSDGNVEPFNTVHVKIDTVAPTFAFTTANGTSFASATPTINWTASDAISGIDHYTVSVDGGAATTVNGTALGTVLSSLTDGQHNVTIGAVDAAGNVAEKELQFNVAATAGSSTGMLILGSWLIIEAIIAIILALAILMGMKEAKAKEGKKESEEKQGEPKEEQEA